jgi:hypothetical protein
VAEVVVREVVIGVALCKQVITIYNGFSSQVPPSKV